MSLQIKSSQFVVDNENEQVNSITSVLKQVSDFSSTSSNMLPCIRMIECVNNYNDTIRLLCSSLEADIKKVRTIPVTFNKEDTSLSGLLYE